MNRTRLLSSFRSRILLGYGAAILVIALGGAWAAASLLTLGQASESILSDNYKTILAAESMINALERQDSILLAMLLHIAPRGPEEYQVQEAEFQQWLGRAKGNISLPGEKEVLERIEKLHAKWAALAVQVQASGGSDLYRQQVYPLTLDIRDACTRLREINQQAMYAASDSARSQARTTVWRTGLGGLAVLLSGFVLSLLLSSRLAKPVERIRLAAARLAEGDYTAQAPVDGTDEVSQLAGQFNAMAKRLQHFHDMNIGHILAEKRKSEAILQSVDDGIVVVDQDCLVADINPMAARIFGQDPSKAQGRSLLEVLGHEDLLRHARRALESGRQPELSGDEAILTVERGERPSHYQFSVIPVRVGSGPALSAVLLFRDVTRLRELDRLKSEFVMTASHELRTPLTSIGMSVDMLLEKAGPGLAPRDRELLAIAQDDVRRLKALVGELLDLSRIEAGRLELEIGRVDSARLFSMVASILAPQAEKAGVVLSFADAAALPPVLADPNKIAWVLVNLVGNALRHTPAGGSVRVSALTAGKYAHITVADTGEGIPQEQQSRIFEKFVQLKSDRTADGSGLGLAICREMVRAHGGTIWVESEPGRGSTFTFTLPLATGMSQEAAP
ncbi:MAG: ATP-binding protein [Thermodesulfobacteriota bacterium]